MNYPPSSATTVRWGVLGCARVAQQVIIPGIQRSRNGTVRGIASRQPERAREFAERFSISRSYPNYQSLLDDPQVDAVYIPLPNRFHAEWAIRAARNGKHVLCEKPLSCNAREAQEMLDACRQHNVLLMEAFAHRFHPQNLLVKQLVREGRIGKVLGMTAVHGSGIPSLTDIKLDKDLGGGVLMDKGCYCVNTARFLLDSEPVSVFANAEKGVESGVDERTTAMLIFPDNVCVYFDSHYRLAPGNYQQGYHIFGESGRISVPSGFVQLDTYRRGHMVDTSVFVTNAESEMARIDIKAVHQWQLEVEYFADRVLEAMPLDFPAENGLANMRVLDSIYRSSTEGRAVSLQDSGV